MNKIYRLIWNELNHTWVAVSEITKGRGKRASGVVGGIAGENSVVGGISDSASTNGRMTMNIGGCAMLIHPTILALALALAFTSIGTAHAGPIPTQLPTGGQLVAGSASIAQNGAVMNINQTTNRAALNWQTFNVGSTAQVNFNQPSSSSVTLNTVLDSNPSQIFGRITAPGQVFLTNPNGMYFAPGASVEVGGLVATTNTLATRDFMAGNYNFTRNGATGSIINDGNLTASLGGYIALLAPQVRNNGVIIAQMGTVALAAGEGYSLQFDGNNTLANVIVTPATIQTLVENGNAVQAPRGLIILSAQAANTLQGSIINNTGAIEARGINTDGGVIRLEAGNGQTTVSGTLDASSTTGKGGQIVATGQQVTLADGANIAATGATGGGTINIGGGWQGGGGIAQATTVNVSQTVTLDASATDTGNGGTISVWSDVTNVNSTTRVYGTLLAQGGVNGGNGGNIETSGHWVDVTGITVNASAPKGNGGQWLLDPYDYTINSAAATTIDGSLNSGTSVTIDTSSSSGTGETGSGNGNITLAASIAKTAGSDATLTLKAATNIILDATFGITSTAGRLNTVLWANSAAGNGSVILQGSNTITTNGGGLWMGGSATNGSSTTWTPYTSASSITVGDGYAIGTNNTTTLATPTTTTVTGDGVQIGDGVSITTSGGNIAVFGKSNTGVGSGTNSGWVALSGIDFIGGSSATNINSGVGTISMTGVSQPGNASGGDMLGIGFGETVAFGSTGLTITSANTTANAITLSGTYTGTNPGGTYNNYLGLGTNASLTNQNVNITATGAGGGVNLTANTTNVGWGMAANGMTIKTDGGAVSLASNLFELGSSSNGLSVIDTTNGNTVNGGALTFQITNNSSSTNYSGGFTWNGTLTSNNLVGSGSLAGLTIDNFSGATHDVGGLTIGGAGNAYPVTISAAASVAGPISIYGSNINLNANLSSNAASGTAILVEATKNIVLASGGSLTSSAANGGAIVLWANSAAGNGSVILQGSNTITTNGGGLWMGGSATNGSSTTWTPYTSASSITVGDGYAIGTNNTTTLATPTTTTVTGDGVQIGDGVSITTSGGNIAVFGKSNTGVGSGTNSGWVALSGIDFIGGSSATNINSGVGTISMTGVSQPGNASGGDMLGIGFGETVAFGSTGLTITSANTTANAITLSGTYTGTNPGGTYNNYLGLGTNASLTNQNVNITATGAGGGVNLTANTTNVGWGMAANGMTIKTDGGAVSLASNLFELGSSSNGLSVIDTTNGNTVNGGALTFQITNNSSSTNYSGGFTWNGTLTSNNLVGSGSLAGLTIDNFSGATHDVGGLTIGGAGNAYPVTISSAASVAGPISIYGGNLTTSANLASTLSGAGVLLKATGSITDNANITTSNGDITLWSNSAGAAAGGIQLGNNVTLSSTGGWITLGGSAGTISGFSATSTNGTALPQGYAASNTASGIALGTTSANTTTINSGGGNVNINGNATATSGILSGVYASGNLTINSGSGAIALTGASANSYGMELSYGLGSGTGLTMISSKSSGTAISLTGTTTAASSYGIVFDFNCNKYIEATGGGAIAINGTGTGSYYGLFMPGTNVLATTGAITVNGGTAGIYFNSVANTLGALTATGVTASSSNITITGDVVNVGVATAVATSGTLTVQPNSTSFSSALTTTNFSLASTLSALTLGKSGNTAAITVGSATSVAGPISVYGGQVNINANLADTLTTANNGIQIFANSNITFPSSVVTLSTSSASPILLNANSLGTGGSIYSTYYGTSSALTLTTLGGNITLGGGTALNGSGYATSLNVSVNYNGDNHQDGISLDNFSFSSGAGNIVMNGMSYGGATTGGKYAGGMWLGNNGATLTTTTGLIALDGEVQSGASGYTGGYYGIYGSHVSIVSGSGNITVTGNNAATTTTNNAMSGFSSGSITSSSGLITINGNSAASTSTGFSDSASSYIGTASAGTADTNNIIINASSLSIGSGTNVNTTGTLTVQPYGSSTSFTSALTTTNLSLASTISGLTLGKAGNTANITVASAASIAGPISIYGGGINLNANLTSTAANAAILVKGAGDITQASTVAVTTSGGAVTYWANDLGTGGNIWLQGTGSAGASIATSGGNITLSGGTDLTTGYAQGDSIYSNSNSNSSGIMLDTATLNSGGGNIVIRGKGATSYMSVTTSAGSVGNNDGIRLISGNTINSGTGTIDIEGVAVGNQTVEASNGIETNQTGYTKILSAATNTTAITLFGDASATTNTADAFGTFLWGGNSQGIVIAATGTGGGVSLNGKGGSGTAAAGGAHLEPNAFVLAASGPISMTGTAGNISTYVDVDINGTVGFASSITGFGISSPVTASSSNISITADTLSANHVFGTGTFTGSAVQSSGTLTIAPRTTGRAMAVQTSAPSAGIDWVNPSSMFGSSGLFKTGFSSLVFGSSTTGNVTLDNYTFDNPTTLDTSGNAILGAVSIANNALTVNMTGSGSITQTGAVAVSKLDLNGSTSAVTLNTTTNAIGTLAAHVASLSLVDSSALTLGTVGAMNGITATGTVNISTTTGNMTVSQNVATTNTSSSALVLDAGTSDAVGTTADNIILSGSPTVTVGSGGRAILYTGSVSGSTGVTGVVGSGSGNFRYDSKLGSSNFSLALGTSGTYAVYRQQPTLTITANSPTAITYGSAAPTYSATVSGSALNGDTYAQALITQATVTAGGAVSTSGHLTATTHTLTASGAVGQLGYALNYATGSLVVNPLALTGTVVAGSSTYGSALQTNQSVTPSGVLTNDVMGSYTVAVNTTGLLSTSNHLTAGTHTGIETVTGASGADAGN